MTTQIKSEQILNLDAAKITSGLIDDARISASSVNQHLDPNENLDHTAISISAGSGLSGGGTIAANRTLSHANTSSVGNVNNSGNTFIQDMTFDTYGHVTSVTSGSATGVNGFSSGQTWQNPARSSGTTYTNSTGRSIYVLVTFNTVQGGQGRFYSPSGTLRAITEDFFSGNTLGRNTISAIIEPGQTYRFLAATNLGPSTITHWAELR